MILQEQLSKVRKCECECMCVNCWPCSFVKEPLSLTSLHLLLQCTFYPPSHRERGSVQRGREILKIHLSEFIQSFPPSNPQPMQGSIHSSQWHNCDLGPQDFHWSVQNSSVKLRCVRASGQRSALTPCCSIYGAIYFCHLTLTGSGSFPTSRHWLIIRQGGGGESQAWRK